LQEKTT